MVGLPCADEQINLASARLVGEFNANASSCLLPGHGNYSFYGFGLGEQPICIEITASISKDRRSAAFQSPAGCEWITGRHGEFCRRIVACFRNYRLDGDCPVTATSGMR